MRREVPEAKTGPQRGRGQRLRRGGGTHTGQVRVMLVPQASGPGAATRSRTTCAGSSPASPGRRCAPARRRGSSSCGWGPRPEGVNVEVRGYDLEAARTLARAVEAAVKRCRASPTRASAATRGSRAGDPHRPGAGRGPRGVGDPRRRDAPDRAGRHGGRLLPRAGEGVPDPRAAGGGRAPRPGGPPRPDVLADGGGQVPLRNVVETVARQGPVRIERKDQERIVTVTANYTGRRPGLGDRRHPRRAARGARPARLQRRPSAATTRSSRRPSASCCIGFVLALFLVYMVMAGQYES